MFKEWCTPHLKSPSKCLLALLMHECSRREMFAYKAWNVNDEKTMPETSNNSFQYFSFSFHHFSNCDHWVVFTCVGVGVTGSSWALTLSTPQMSRISCKIEKGKQIGKKYPKIPALWKQSPGFWGTPWSLWPLLQDPYHTWWWGWWWWDWWTSLVVLFVR